MSTTSPEAVPGSAPIPSYITSATPNPAEKRAPWYKNTAPTYAGIFLWFVFWQDVVQTPNPGGGLAAGVGVALLGLLISALICHFLFYLVPGLLGMKTGLPLYIVGTSTFGAIGGFLMPGFLMGVLQFGWLGVNTYFSSLGIAQVVPVPAQVIMVIWGVLAAFVGLKGIQYVAKVATFFPIVPLAILVIVFFKTIGGVGSFDPQKLIAAQQAAHTSGPAPLSAVYVLAFLLTYVVGFFATAGAAGVDFGSNSRDQKDVSLGGLVGVALAALVTGGLSALIVAGVYGTPGLSAEATKAAQRGLAKFDPRMMSSLNDVSGLPSEGKDQIIVSEVNQVLHFRIFDGDGKMVADTDETRLKEHAGEIDKLRKQIEGLWPPHEMTKSEKDQVNTSVASIVGHTLVSLRSADLIPVVLGATAGKWMMLLLALASFPPACFSSFIAANSFKTTLPKVNPFLSVGIGAAVSILLALSGLAGKVVPVFVIIGASFGPICGAMMVDYLLAGNRWTGPRAGFNPAGWVSWALGFVVGILPNLGVNVPAAPVAAFLVGAVLYFLCAKVGLLSPVLPLPAASEAK
jgi:cytosine/uracil/thiamine/allantoin permease